MYLKTKISTKIKLFYNLLISLFPIFFIAGNMLINIGTILLILSALICFGKKIFELQFQFFDKILVGFFTLVIITGIVNDYYYFAEITGWERNFATLKKSIFFFKIFFYILDFEISY